MATDTASIIKPTKQRLASEYKDVERAVLDRGIYPCTLTSLNPPTHDLAYSQSILSNGANFAERTLCDILDVRAGNKVSKRSNVNDEDLRSYLKSCVGANVPNATRLIFLTSKRAKGTTFASQVSLEQSLARELLETFEVSPHFVPLLVGEPEYAAPGTYHELTIQGQLSRQEYICQHPRWDSHTKLLPCSVYMSFQKATAVTTYIVVSGETDSCIDISRKRLEEALGITAPGGLPFPQIADPFYFHSIVAQESFQQSKPIITKLRHRLYDALDKVDAYGAGEQFLDRAALRALTNELHLISQDADSLVSSAEMGTMVTERMHAAHGHLKAMSDLTSLQGFTPVDDSLGYLAQTLQARRRWLLSYKSRKDIAMNLVFNLVTQQDSETNMSIAQATKNDSAAMKTIAALTMIFLPATAVSSFFGMAFFNGQGGEFTVTSDWWLFLVLTIPITLVLFLVWLKWHSILSAVEMAGRLSSRGLTPIRLRFQSDADSDTTKVNSGSSTQSSPERDVSKMV